MSLWRRPIYSQMPLAPVWRALGRYNYGVEHYWLYDAWHLDVYALRKVNGEWLKVEIVRLERFDEWDVVMAALPWLPGIGVRLALLGVQL